MAQYIGITGLNRSAKVRVPAYTEVDTPADDLAATVVQSNAVAVNALAADEYFYAVTVLAGGGEGLPSNEDSATVSDANGVNEVQSVDITGTPAGGSFTLSYGGQTTAAIAHDANAAAVDLALTNLSTIGATDVAVTGTNPNFAVEFTSNLAGQPIATLTASGAGLTGGTAPAVAVTTDTQGVYPDTVNLAWTAVPGADGYRVYKGTATGDYSEYFELDGDTTEFTDDGTAGTAGDVPAESSAVSSGAPASVGVGDVVIVDVDDVEVRKALSHHTSVGQYAVVAVNNEVGGTALPANS